MAQEALTEQSEWLCKKIRENNGKLPLLTLGEFFDRNTTEDSLAPNQWGYGRPPLVDICMRLREIEKRLDVAWVRVQLHPDTLFEDREGNVHCEMAGEAIAICTTAKVDEIADAVDCETLCSDGVVEGWVADPDDFSDIPLIPHDYRVVSLVWD